MKKILTIVISVALVAAIAIGGSLAYLTSNAQGKTLVNTFVFGSGLTITLDEGEINQETGKFIDSGTTRVEKNSYPIIPGATMDKDPTITVKADSEPCYVFAYVNNSATLNSLPVVSIVEIGENWTLVQGQNGLYVYCDQATKTPKIVCKEKDSDQPLPDVFTQIKISSGLKLTDLSEALVGGLNVQAYAHQASGDVTYDMAEQAAIKQFFPQP